MTNRRYIQALQPSYHCEDCATEVEKPSELFKYDSSKDFLLCYLCWDYHGFDPDERVRDFEGFKGEST